MIYMVIVCINIGSAVLSYSESKIMAAGQVSLSVFFFYLALEEMIIKILSTGA